LCSTLSTGDVGTAGAIGNVISISIRATMAYWKQEINDLQPLWAYGKSDADPKCQRVRLPRRLGSVSFRARLKANGGVMISLMNRLADSHFRRAPSGRVVFIPFTRSGKCYFVDSKADEEKVRAFVNMYRTPTTLITLLMTPMVTVPALILEDYGGLTPISASMRRS
jgi:hypothetical protein